jgi:hypothetical protein
MLKRAAKQERKQIESVEVADPDLPAEEGEKASA